jgi:hypothetical protein
MQQADNSINIQPPGLVMKRLVSQCMIIVTAVLLNACSGGGSSAPAPLNVTAVAGDSSVTVTWDSVPGVTYWLYTAAGSEVTTENCVFMSQCTTTLNAASPAVIAGTFGLSGLTNGTTYSFTINGRINGGPGGPGSPATHAVPRLAGGTWVAGTPTTSASNLRGVTTYVPPGQSVANGFVAVDEAGVLYSSLDGRSWTPASTVNTSRLNAVTHSGGVYVAVGAAGKVLRSTDGANWATPVSGTAQDLYAVTSNGAARFIATGAGGTILYSDDGITWSTAASVPPVNLYAVAYSNYAGGSFIAAGAAGTLLTSINGGVTWQPVTWQPGSTQPSADLHGVAFSTQSTAGGLTYGTNAANTPNPTSTIGASGVFVAVGVAGTLVTSLNNGAAWTVQPSIGAPTLNAVSYWHQFVAVGDDGAIFTSTDGINWVAQSAVAGGDLYAVTPNPAVYGYSAVGELGRSFLSR